MASLHDRFLESGPLEIQPSLEVLNKSVTAVPCGWLCSINTLNVWVHCLRYVPLWQHHILMRLCACPCHPPPTVLPPPPWNRLQFKTPREEEGVPPTSPAALAEGLLAQSQGRVTKNGPSWKYSKPPFLHRFFSLEFAVSGPKLFSFTSKQGGLYGMGLCFQLRTPQLLVRLKGRPTATPGIEQGQ